MLIPELALLVAFSAIVLAALALRVARGAQKVATNGQSPAQVIRAFKDLEGDFSKLETTVHSELGRMSRLKREALDLKKIAGILESQPKSEGGSVENGDVSSVAEPSGSPDFSPPTVPLPTLSERQKLYAAFAGRKGAKP